MGARQLLSLEVRKRMNGNTSTRKERIWGGRRLAGDAKTSDTFTLTHFDDFDSYVHNKSLHITCFLCSRIPVIGVSHTICDAKEKAPVGVY